MKDIPTSARAVEIRRKRRKYKRRLFVLFSVLFISIIVALAYFSADRHFTIDQINIKGAQVIDPDKIEKEIRSELSGRYFYLFARSNGLIYPEKQIYDNLLVKFPRIKTLTISSRGLKTLDVEISERVGSYLYCGANVPEDKNQIGENCYFLNDNGLIFDKAPYISGNVYFKYYMSINDGDDNPLGKQMINVNSFHKLVRFVDGITSLGFIPVYFVSEKDGTDSIYLNHIETDTAPKITFKNEDDLDKLLDNFTIAMSKKEFADDIHSKYNKLLYIDLRFKNKVLYKFQ